MQLELKRTEKKQLKVQIKQILPRKIAQSPNPFQVSVRGHKAQLPSMNGSKSISLLTLT